MVIITKSGKMVGCFLPLQAAEPNQQEAERRHRRRKLDRWAEQDRLRPHRHKKPRRRKTFARQRSIIYNYIR